MPGAIEMMDALAIHASEQMAHAGWPEDVGAALTLSTYGHVIDELEDAPSRDAETAILAARASCAARELPIMAN